MLITDKDKLKAKIEILDKLEEALKQENKNN